jgi:error-prone DNA polymerase
VIEEVWEMMMGFDGYSFCKPHSASYTLVAYKSAFLRAHYPAEFMAAVIANGGGYYGTLGYLSEARRMGLDVLPPDINKSEIPYTGRDKTIRIGLMQLKGISQEALEGVVRNRNRQGPFISLEDFLQRMGRCLHLKDVRILIRGGCFDTIAPGLSRPALMWKGLRFFRHSDQVVSRLKRGPVRGNLPLFDGEDRPLPKPGPYSKGVRWKHEWDTFGFLVSSHPLDRYRDILNRMAYVKACDLRAWVGKEVTTVGWLVTGKTVSTKKGDPMKFVSFEDTTGLYEAVFFPKEYQQFCQMLNRMRPYILRGKVEEDFGAITLTVKGVGFLDRYERKSPGGGLDMISSRGAGTVDPYQNFPEISEEMVK